MVSHQVSNIYNTYIAYRNGISDNDTLIADDNDDQFV